MAPRLRSRLTVRARSSLVMAMAGRRRPVTAPRNRRLWRPAQRLRRSKTPFRPECTTRRRCFAPPVAVAPDTGKRILRGLGWGALYGQWWTLWNVVWNLLIYNHGQIPPAEVIIWAFFIALSLLLEEPLSV